MNKKNRLVRSQNFEKISLAVSIVGLLGTTYFLLPNFTGDVVATSYRVSTNIVGGALFIIGIAGAVTYFKNKYIHQKLFD